ncbi:hypothetical protein COOONC_15676 [Cooperia oncophora]
MSILQGQVTQAFVNEEMFKTNTTPGPSFHYNDTTFQHDINECCIRVHRYGLRNIHRCKYSGDLFSDRVRADEQPNSTEIRTGHPAPGHSVVRHK